MKFKIPFIKIPSILSKRWFQALLFILIVLGSYFYWQAKQKNKNGFETYTIGRQNLQQTVIASGKITAERQASLKFQTVGQLAWVGAKKGDRVEKWQAIASINQEQLKKQLKKDLLDYMNERMDFDETTKTTYKDTALTDTISRLYVKAQNDLDLTVLDVEISDIAKKYATLVTPIAGIVTKATEEYPGLNVYPTTTEYVVTDPESLRFTAQVEELDIGLISENKEAKITLDAFPDETFKSRVQRIEFTSVETVGGTTAYEVQLPLSQNFLYRLDMSGDAEIIILEKNNILAIPIEAVEIEEDQKFVNIKLGDKQEKKEIKTGLETDDFYEITEGLDENDIVILPK